MAVKLGYQQSPDHVRRRMSARLATLAAKPKPVSKEWLEARYEAEGLDCVQIGKLVGRDPKTVWSWIRHYGIPTRPRGANHKHLPKDGSAFKGRKHTPETRALLSEIALADGRVPFDPAVGPPMRGKRGADTFNWKGGITPERQAFYSSEEWKSSCKAVWARANARCERCGIHHNTAKSRGTFHVHHRVSFMVRELRAAVNNLVLLCAPCHRFVHSRKNKNKQFIEEIKNVDC